MKLVSDTATKPELLRQVADWTDHPAWAIFHARYDPLLRSWCRSHNLDSDSIDEVCQRIWVELADRMRTFRYDPQGTFRGWLRRVCESRVIDFVRQQRLAKDLLNLDDRCGEIAPAMDEAGEGAQCEADNDRLSLLVEAEKVQDAVKKRIQPRTWEAFWLVAVCDWTVERTAQTLGMTHVAVYAARDRVARMLRDEGNLASDRLRAQS